jgi:hypothetical protein
MSASNKRPWLPSEIATMLRMREQERRTWAEIDRTLKRPTGSSSSKYETVKRGREVSGNTVGGGRVVLTEEQIAAQAARKAAENKKTLTAAVLGDPPPGYSALDRRGGP